MSKQNLKSSRSSRRIDQWLFFARLTKSRSLAGRLVEAGRVRINKEKINKASHIVQVGDVITAMINKHLLVVEIKQLGARRGPFKEAQLLYEDLTPKVPQKVEEQFHALAPSRPKGYGRPTKKDRRMMDLLKQNSAKSLFHD